MMLISPPLRRRAAGGADHVLADAAVAQRLPGVAGTARARGRVARLLQARAQHRQLHIEPSSYKCTHYLSHEAGSSLSLPCMRSRELEFYVLSPI